MNVVFGDKSPNLMPAKFIAKFNACQYYHLYGMLLLPPTHSTQTIQVCTHTQSLSLQPTAKTCAIVHHSVPLVSVCTFVTIEFVSHALTTKAATSVNNAIRSMQ